MLPIAAATLTNPTATSRLELSARFFGHRTFPTGHRTFPSCAPNRVARSPIYSARRRDRSGRPAPFVDRVTRVFPRRRPAGPTGQRISQGSRRTHRAGRRTRHANQLIVNPSQATRRSSRPTRRYIQCIGRIAQPVVSIRQLTRPRGARIAEVSRIWFFSRSTGSVVPASVPHCAADPLCSATS